MGYKTLFLSVALLLVSQFAEAAVTQVDEHYFAIKIEKTLKLSPHQLNQKILQIGRWWSPEHTYTGDSANLSIDLAKRCFCEQLPAGGFVVHLPLVYYQPDKLLRFVGGLGPLQALPVDGVLQFQIKAIDAQHSQLIVTYEVSSNAPGVKDWAGGVNQVIEQQVNRLTQQDEQQ